MSHQGNSWEREYRDPKLVTGHAEPQGDTLRFFKFLNKEREFRVEGRAVLDLGCGTGRNSNYLADIGNAVIGIEISPTALGVAQARAKELGVAVDYRRGDIGEAYDIPTESIDVILDVTASNSLDERGRAVYLQEMRRVLKPGGYAFVRALCKESDKNVKALLQDSPGREKDTYILKDIGLTERVFSREDILALYGAQFNILKLDKKTGYSTMGGRVYKRNYWLAYLQK